MGGQAFSGKRLTGFFMDPDEIRIIGLDTDDGEEHPLYDPRVHDPLPEGMVESIMEFGVLQAVKVRKNGPTAELLDGRYRVRGARAANILLRAAGKTPVQVPFTIGKPRSDADALGISVVMNEFRTDDSILVRAGKAARLAEFGMPEDEVAAKFGVTPQTITAWVKLLDASPSVRKAIEQGKISPTAATKLARHTHEKQDEALEGMLSSGNATVAAADERNRAARGGGSTRPVSTAPARSTLRAMVKEGTAMAKDGRLDPVVLRVLKWAAGDGKPPREVSGLLRRVG